MQVALYARVSTREEQDPETQLMPLRDWAVAEGWGVYREYVDTAPAGDLNQRVAWRELLDDAARRRFKAVLVFKLDRAFRSVKHMHDTLAAWGALGLLFRSRQEQFDTSTALGRLLMNLLASLAEFELELIRERVKAGMARASRQGKRVGRKRVTDRPGFRRLAETILASLRNEEISVSEAARRLHCGRQTVRLLRDGKHVSTMEKKHAE